MRKHDWWLEGCCSDGSLVVHGPVQALKYRGFPMCYMCYHKRYHDNQQWSIITTSKGLPPPQNKALGQPGYSSACVGGFGMEALLTLVVTYGQVTGTAVRAVGAAHRVGYGAACPEHAIVQQLCRTTARSSWWARHRRCALIWLRILRSMCQRRNDNQDARAFR